MVTMFFFVRFRNRKTSEPEVARLMTSLMTSANCFSTPTFLLLTCA